MLEIFTQNETADLSRRGFSRRNFHRMATLVAAGAALPFYNEQALAQRPDRPPIPPDAVRINANENPMGPCPEAAEAIHAIVQRGGRYLNEEGAAVATLLAEQEGVKRNYVTVFPGSSDPLHRAVLSFTAKDRPYVVADPGYEAGARAAEFIGAPVMRVPLIKGSFKHDVKAMVAAAPNAGLFYICNPNNPTGTITPQEDIEWLVANKPAGSVVLIDEAYIHLSTAAMSSYLVGADKDVMVLRTFSKLYGMAGLRAGAAIAKPELLAKLSNYGNGMLPARRSILFRGRPLRSRRRVAGRRSAIGASHSDHARSAREVGTTCRVWKIHCGVASSTGREQSMLEECSRNHGSEVRSKQRRL